MQARDIMTTKVLSINSGANIRHAIDLMVENNVSGLPVIDDLGRVCGMLTEGDLLTRTEINPNPARSVSARYTSYDLVNYIQSKGWCVADVMTANVVAVTPDTPISVIANLMAARRIRRILVLDEGRLVGIVSRRDLLRAIVRAAPDAIASGDEAIRLAVATRLRTELGLDSDHVDVTVRNTQVSVTGSVESELQRRAIRVLVESIGGAGGFVDRLDVVPRTA